MTWRARRSRPVVARWSSGFSLSGKPLIRGAGRSQDVARPAVAPYRSTLEFRLQPVRYTAGSRGQPKPRHGATSKHEIRQALQTAAAGMNGYRGCRPWRARGGSTRISFAAGAMKWDRALPLRVKDEPGVDRVRMVGGDAVAGVGDNEAQLLEPRVQFRVERPGADGFR